MGSNREKLMKFIVRVSRILVKLIFYKLEWLGSKDKIYFRSGRGDIIRYFIDF